MTSEDHKIKDYMFEAAFKPSGYYYTKFVHTYKDVTLKELDVVNDLAVELIAESQHVNEQYIKLELKDIKYQYMSRTEVYYAKNLGPILGKLTIVVQDMTSDHYNVSIIFAEHRVMPKSARRNANNARKHMRYKPLGKNKDETIKAYRLKSRAWRRGGKSRNYSGDIKSDN